MKDMRRLYAEGGLNDTQALWMADHRPSEELYDIEADPWETKNLAGDARYSGTKKRLEKVLGDWMIETRDTGLLPEPTMKRLVKEYGSEYAILHRSGGENLTKKLLQIAIIASEPKACDRETIYKAFQGDDSSERYWAVIALGRLTPNNDVDKLQKASIDEEASVRIAAARSLYWAGRKKEAVELLKKELEKPGAQEESLHFALDVLQNFGDDAKGAMEALKPLTDKKIKSKYVRAISAKLLRLFRLVKS
jgi:uncharacterized sulfatase